MSTSLGTTVGLPISASRVASDAEPIEVPGPARTPRNAVETDRLEAAAFYAYGQLYAHRQRWDEALRHFQRATRCDPESSAIQSEIITMSYATRRPDIALRYALRCPDRTRLKPFLLQDLALRAAESLDFVGAVTLYEASLANLPAAPRNQDHVLLHHQLARVYFLTEKWAKAAESLQVVLQALDQPHVFGLNEEHRQAILGDPNVSYAFMAETFLAAEQPDTAEKLFELADQFQPNPPLLAFHKARVAAQQQRRPQALELLETYFAAQCTAAGQAPFRLYEDLLQQQGQAELVPNTLLAKWTKEYTSHPDNLEIGRHLADLYARQAKLPEAITLQEAILAAEPSLESYQHLADLYRRHGQPKKLVQLLGRFVEQTESVQALQTVIEPAARDPQFVEHMVRASQEIDSCWTHLALALFYIETKRGPESIPFFQAARDKLTKSRPTRLIDWGLELLLAGEHKAASEFLEQVAAGEEVEADLRPLLYHHLCTAYEFESRPEEALHAAQQAVDLAPNEPRMLSRLGWSLYRAGRLGEARAVYERLLTTFDRQPPTPAIREVVRSARMMLSTLCADEGQIAAAEDWLEQVLDEFPDDIGAQNDLGYLWADQGKHLHRALRMSQAAVEAEPQNPAYRDTLGWTQFRLGNDADALVQLQEALKLSPETDGVIWEHLGDIRAHMGDHAGALAAWETAASQFARKHRPDRAANIRQKMDKVR